MGWGLPRTDFPHFSLPDFFHNAPGQHPAPGVVKGRHLARRAGKLGRFQGNPQALAVQDCLGRDGPLAVAQTGQHFFGPIFRRHKNIGRPGQAGAHAQQGARPHDQGIARPVLAQHIQRLAVGDAQALALALGVAPETLMPSDFAQAVRRTAGL